jgi:fumarylacetoacetate (FAA) hydrolase family protein
MTAAALTDPTFAIPADRDALLVGRAWSPAVGGPVVVVVRDGALIDASASAPTMSALTESPDPTALARSARGEVVGSLDEVLANTPEESRDASRPWLLSPIDLHVVKAAGVTFPVSMLERIIEERSLGDASAATDIRSSILAHLGGELRDLVPGSPEAARVKQALIDGGMWSQYLEVGIGPDAEIFTKAPVLATVGTGVRVGVREDSEWNNPEPEIVLVIASTGAIVGATLGNDVNLRDIEGRSALLLGQAKDNASSAAVGPFIRLFDDGFSLDDVRTETVSLRVDGPEGYVLEARSPMTEISRDPADLAAQAVRHHCYPDGFVLYLGTLFAPIDDRDAPGRGFTHRPGDIVTISAPRLGALVNRVALVDDVEPWRLGITGLMTNLARRGLLTGSSA